MKKPEIKQDSSVAARPYARPYVIPTRVQSSAVQVPAVKQEILRPAVKQEVLRPTVISNAPVLDSKTFPKLPVAEKRGVVAKEEKPASVLNKKEKSAPVLGKKEKSTPVIKVSPPPTGKNEIFETNCKVPDSEDEKPEKFVIYPNGRGYYHAQSAGDPVWSEPQTVANGRSDIRYAPVSTEKVKS